ncbi:RluA family pseudouridine synthase [Listeria aquatica]
MIMLKIEILPEWESQTLTELFRDTFHLGKKSRHELRMSQDFTLDGSNKPNWESELSAGQILTVPLQKENAAKIESGSLDISYEDDFILVLNKPAGVKTHPNSPDETGTLANFAAAYLKHDPTSSPFAVHRLDQETSGLVLFAKNPLSLAAFSWQLENRNIHRIYLALVSGKTPETLTIKERIGTDRHHPNKMCISPTGKNAITHMEWLETYPNATSLVRLKLETGRTHQIRVHLASIHHPIIGDKLYGGAKLAKRTLLHAEQLEFFHPFLNQTLSVKARPPKDFIID